MRLTALAGEPGTGGGGRMISARANWELGDSGEAVAGNGG